MKAHELERLLDGFTNSAFRLEQLQTYTVPQEEEDVAAFMAGQRRPLDTPETNPWFAKIAADIAAGKRWYRVRILEYPLTPYTEYELWGYQENIAAGEEVFVAAREDRPVLDELRTDFWLIDDSLAVEMHYDDAGRFLGAARAPDEYLGEYQRQRDIAMSVAVPLDAYTKARRTA